MSDTEHVATYETPADAGKPPVGTVTRWVKELDLADSTEADWRKHGRAVTKRFRDEEQLEKGAKKARKLGAKFNILRPNIRVTKAAIYQEAPKPDVRRRFQDKDPLGKAVSEVTERSLAFCMDKYDFDGAMVKAIDDMLKPGRGVTRVRYEPQTMPQVGSDKKPMQGPDGQPMEQITWEKCCFKHVNWEDFRRGPGRTWEEVPWVAYRWRLTREEAIDKLPKAKALLQTIDLDCQMDGISDDDEALKKNPGLKDVFKRLTVWEIWDKTKREVIFIAPSHKERPLEVQSDPLRLEEFFDIPRPLYATEESDTLIPLDDFRAYADQAKELDNITARIDGIVSQLKVRGLYDGTIKSMASLMEGGDGTLLPADEVAALYNNGGLEKAIWLMPIEKIAQILGTLYEQREQTKQIIYEITGLSDILRGSSKASETATAQSIKAQNGAMSIQDRRKAVKRYGRDLVRIASEIICEHFQQKTLQAMTGSDYPTEQEKQQLQFQLQQMQMAAAQAAQAAPPDMPGAPPAAPQQPPVDPAQIEAIQQRLAMPTWEQIIEVMRSDALRSYRIDVETDETAFGDQQAEQQAVTELLTGSIEFMTAAAPLIQGGMLTPEIAKSMLMLAVRRFRAGREIEAALEEIGEQPIPPPADPNAGKIDVERQRLEADQADREQARAFEREKHEATMAREQEKHAFEKERHAAEMARAAKQDQFAERSHADDMAQRGREFEFTQRDADQQRGHAERLAQIKTKPAANILVGNDGKVAEMTEGTAGVADAVRGMTEALGKLLAMNAAAEQRQAAAIAGMGEQIGAAIIKAMTMDRVPERGADGKIKRIKVVPPKGAAPANGQVQ